MGEISNFLPQVNLEILAHPGGLAGLLTPELLDQTAALFEVRRSWLSGKGDQIYDLRHCYERPESFFADIAAAAQSGAHPVIAVSASSELDFQNGGRQSLVLIVAERLSGKNPANRSRYAIYADDWRWHDRKGRIQLKAMGRVFFDVLGRIIPLCRVDHRMLLQIRAGRRVPGSCLQDPDRYFSLEEDCAGSNEHAQNQEWNELQEVSHYIDRHDLRRLARKLLRPSDGNSTQQALWEAIASFCASIKEKPNS